MYTVTPKQMKAAEANAVAMGQTWYGLMENAGRAAAEELLERKPHISRALILCGKGNNGGDGYVIARILSQKGTEVTVAVTDTAPTGTAGEMFDLIRGSEAVTVISFDDIDTDAKYDVIVDAVFGTGFHGELPEKISTVFSKLKRSSAFKLAVDIPSGVDSVTGRVSENTFICDLTVTFGAVKLGMTMPEAKKHCGETELASIGIDDMCFSSVIEVMSDETANLSLPLRNEYSHKGHFGRLLMIAGSDAMSGAAALNVMGALRSGAGLVKLASVRSVIDRVGSGIYECTFLPLRASDSGAISMDNIPVILKALSAAEVVTIGSGLTCCSDTKVILEAVIKYCGGHDIPVIIDADGLNCLADCIDIIRTANCRAVLTPHVGELARLLGVTNDEVSANRLSAAKKLSEITGAVVAAKGYPTFIVSPDGPTAVSYTGNGGLSRGGSGDVLTGVISGMTAADKGRDLFGTAGSGVYVFGKAADLAAEKLSQTGMLPSDVIAQLPFAFRIG